MDNRFFAVHMHNYQPPRGDPHTNVIPLQPSAAPFANWNERINFECYKPNGWARILNSMGNVTGFINNYEWASFNIGPTLLLWLERYAPDTLSAVIEGDRLSCERNGGHGNAIAQVYNHIIMPLGSSHDKKTQVAWGIATFQKYFGRFPEGMHLSECAVDTATLEALAEAGIKFTVLSPRQAKRIRAIGGQDSDWQIAGLDTTRPYRVSLPSGKSIAIFFYDGGISQKVAFGDALDRGENFLNLVLGAYNIQSSQDQLVHVSVDGETFGHHHRYGEMCLAWLFNHFNSKDSGIKVTNYGHYLATHSVEYEVEIHEASSWSCEHGVERWRSDCGCKAGTNGSKWHQKWRRPLRDGLSALALKLDQIFVSSAAEIFKDPWLARDLYIEVVLGNLNIADFMQTHLKNGKNSPKEMEKARVLLEMEHYKMLSDTSCAWFFDDVAGIEPIQNLLYAARAIEFASQLTDAGIELEQLLLEHLERAIGNQPEYENGRVVWMKVVKPLIVQKSLEALLADGLDLEVSIDQVLRVLKNAIRFNLSFDKWSLQTDLLKAFCHRTGSGDIESTLQVKFEEAAVLLGIEPHLLGWCRAVHMPFKAQHKLR